MAVKRPSTQERGRGGGGERGTEIKRLQDKTGKRKGAAAATDPAATRMTATEKKAAFYEKIVEKDYGYLFFTDEQAQSYPGGRAAARAMNNTIRQVVKEFREPWAATSRDIPQAQALASPSQVRRSCNQRPA
ncbi:hypothetical protein SEVIR_2G394200v4 [Setaria viridis]|uniref:Uncharacterized protein n=2 Tax=Setaria TaxID=4554 RepID=A0A368Q7R2_SETIT|nr:hypothetical protein SETIT_2G383800v2 [Setaria italica]TKW35722.1 hypothetical protein SEVIR_2G394200v2 [Setaria viridis]